MTFLLEADNIWALKLRFDGLCKDQLLLRYPVFLECQGSGWHFKLKSLIILQVAIYRLDQFSLIKVNAFLKNQGFIS